MAANFTLQLAPNALHYERISSFEYYEDARISILSPASGPMTGGAQLLLIGHGFRSGSHAQCWLGSGRINATVYAGGSQLRCISPPGTNVGDTTLRVALNGQQASDDFAFTFYNTPTPKLLLPDNGDASNAPISTLVRVLETGDGFNASGTDLRCRFGDSAGPSAVRPATLVSGTELRCTAPPNATAAVVQLRVSLNAQQYGPGLLFDLLPEPQVSHIEPSSGVYSGGALVDVTGGGFFNMNLQSILNSGKRSISRFQDQASSTMQMWVLLRLKLYVWTLGGYGVCGMLGQACVRACAWIGWACAWIGWAGAWLGWACAWLGWACAWLGWAGAWLGWAGACAPCSLP